MAIGNISARKRGFGYDPVTRSLGVYVDGALAASFPPTPGRTYFVNNITGSSSNDGLSWANAMDEVSTAITASETYRALGGVEGGASVDTNDYVRNTIIIQGTGTAYTKLTSMALYADIIGLGADPRGNGAGIARIGSDTVAESGVVLSSTVRGLNVYNLQFQAGLSKYCWQHASIYRSRFENCTFMTNGSATGNPTGAFYSTTAMGGVVIDDCLIGGSNCSIDTEPDTGLIIAGTHFHTCVVRNCQIYGLAGMTVASTVVASWGSIVKDNIFGDGSQAMAICINDDQTGGYGHIVYAGNYLLGTGVVMDVEDDGDRCIGNYEKGALIAGNA